MGETPAGLAAGLTLRSMRVRAVDVPLERPLQTAVAEMRSAPLALIDLESQEGVTGSSYVFCYTPVGQAAVVATLEALAPSLAGEVLDPVPLWSGLRRRMTLLGTGGIVATALGGIDMAAWDAAARAARLPLARLLGGSGDEAVPAYASLRTIREADLAEEAATARAQGHRAFKIKIGAGDLESDVRVLATMRSVIGDAAALMCDYNQSLSLAEARRRLRRLDAEGLAWIEEPVAADDVAAMASLTRETTTPIMAGESWWSPREAARNLAADASDLVMPDVCRVGVTGWMRIAALAETAGVPVSSHLYPEFSRHLLAATPAAGLLEHLDVAAPVLAEPVDASDGLVAIPPVAGAGIEWDEDAVSRHAVAG